MKFELISFVTQVHILIDGVHLLNPVCDFLWEIFWDHREKKRLSKFVFFFLFPKAQQGFLCETIKDSEIFFMDS